MKTEKEILTLLHNKLDFKKNLHCKVKFDINLSKNKWRVGNGRMYLEEEPRNARDLLTYTIKNEIRKNKVTFEVKKVYVGVYVIKPNMRSDALNIVDGVMDSVKKAINVDDRWFSISRLDWDVSKKEPYIYILIQQ